MALNDPQWGKKGNDGPPDLDEIFRKFNQKLSGLFGGKGGNGSRPPEVPTARQWGTSQSAVSTREWDNRRRS